MAAPIRYRIVPKNAHAHVFEVSCRVEDPDPAGQRFRLPTWIPGSYLVREFARNVVRLAAADGSSAIAVTKTAKDTWQCVPAIGPITVTYEVYAWDLSVRAALLDSSRGFFTGPSVFLEPVGKADRQCELEIGPPPGQAGATWRVATALPRGEVDANGFGRYRASDYDELLDHPVEMGDLATRRFEAAGVPHEIAITGRHDADLDRIAGDTARICAEQIALFHGAEVERPPFDYYLFQVLALGEGYGGLEHRASTSLICRRSDLPRAGDTSVSEGYRSFLGLVSHEYFHAWHVKRIKPAAFLPYDLSGESYTRQLWIFEGFTSYYDDLCLVRCGLITPAEYLELLGRAVSTLLHGSGRHKQSLAEASFDAWIKYYRQDENAPNSIVSYYGKGSLVALALDLTLRSETAVTLDDLMRALWVRYGRAGLGVPEDGVERLVEELAGRSFAGFFERFVHGTDDPPLAELLPRFGVRYGLRASEGSGDKGGTGPAVRKALPVSLGVKLGNGPEAQLANVLDDGAAQVAGLSAGDVLVAIDGLRVKSTALDDVLRRFVPGDRIRIHAFRRDELLEVEATLQAPGHDTCWLEIATDAPAEVGDRRSAWLHLTGGTKPAGPGPTASN